MIEKKRLIPVLLAAALLGAPVLLIPQEATAQLGTCFQCVYSETTQCMMCRHFTESGEDDCTTPQCMTCGPSNPCDPQLAAAAESAAGEVIEAIRTRLATQVIPANAPATDMAFAATVSPAEEPAGTIASIRRELNEHNLYLSADGDVRTCDGKQVGRISPLSPDRLRPGSPVEIAQVASAFSGPLLRPSDGPAASIARQR